MATLRELKQQILESRKDNQHTQFLIRKMARNETLTTEDFDSSSAARYLPCHSMANVLELNQKLENDKPFMNTIVSRVAVESWAYHFIIVSSFFIISCTDSTSDGARQDWTCSNSCGKICPKDNEVLIDGGAFAAVFLVRGLQDQSIWWTAEAWELQRPAKHCQNYSK